MNHHLLKTLLLIVMAVACRAPKHGPIGPLGTPIEPPSLIDVDSFAFARSDSRRIGVVRFRLAEKALCTYRIWPASEPAPDPTSTPRKPCDTSEGQEFSFTEPGLNPASYYRIEVRAWHRAHPEAVDQKSFVEKDNGHASPEPTAMADKLIVMRMDLNTGTAEAHLHSLESPRPRPSLAASLQRKDGCQVERMDFSQYSKASEGEGLRSILSRGFGNSNSLPHSQRKGVHRFAFADLQFGAPWTLTADLDGKSHSIQSRTPLYLSELQVGAGTKVTSPPDTEGNYSGTLDLVPSKDLEVTWTTQGVSTSDNTHVVLRIGNPETPDTIHCVFAAQATRAVIPATLLSGLPARDHVLDFVLEDLLWLNIDSSDTTSDAPPPWLIRSYDWRVLLLRKGA